MKNAVPLHSRCLSTNMAMRNAELVALCAISAVDVEDLLLVSHAPSRSRPQIPPSGFRLSLDSLSDDKCFSMFRFSKTDILRLAHLLRLPKKIVCSNRTISTPVEGLCILLRRLTYPNRLADLSSVFGRSESELSMICKEVLEHIYQNFNNLLQDLDGCPWVKPEFLQIYSDAVHQNGAPLTNVWGFIDGTARPICRPKLDQKVAYSGHKRVHCLKYQGIVTPNGLVVSCLGPFEGRRHDAGILGETGLLRSLRDNMNGVDGEPFSLYGDPAYPLCGHLISPYKGATISPEEKEFNEAMSAQRICVEWVFGKVLQNFAFVDYKKNNKLHLQPVGKLYLVAVFLTNCHTCLYGSQTSDMFGLSPPTLEEYLE